MQLKMPCTQRAHNLMHDAPSAAAFVIWPVAMSANKRDEILRDPRLERRSLQRSRGERQKDLLPLFYRRAQLESIQHEECFKRGVANPLVAVDEGMIAHKRKREGSSLLYQRRIELDAVERRAWLRQCGFETTKVAEPGGPAGLFDHALMEDENLGERQVADHDRDELRETTIEVAILVEDMRCRRLELVFAPIKEIA